MSETLITESAAAEQTAQTTPTPGLAGADGVFATGWTEKLPEALGDARKNFERYKSVGDLATAYHSLHARLGKHATATYVPGEDATPEEISAFRKAMGVPETAEAYKLKPDQLPDGLEWNDENVKPYLALFHEHGISEKAAKALIAVHLEQEKARHDSVSQMAEANSKSQLESGTAKLKQTWGDKYDTNVTKVAQAFRSLGGDPSKAAGLTDPDTVIVLSRLVDMISDDKFVTGDAPSLGGNAQAARDIMTNPKNPLYDKYQSGDTDTVERVRSMLQRG